MYTYVNMYIYTYIMYIYTYHILCKYIYTFIVYNITW